MSTPIDPVRRPRAASGREWNEDPDPRMTGLGSLRFRVAETTPGLRLGLAMLRWSLVVVFLRFGPLKFTQAEARGVEPLISHSPLLGWMMPAFGVQGASDVLGVLETATALVLAAGAFVAVASALGAAMSCTTYLITLTLFLSTPGLNTFVEGGAPIGLFLIKDVVLLAASACLLQASIAAPTRRRVR